MRHVIRLAITVFLLVATVFASIFGSVHGIVHDPQHRPIQGATVTVKSNSSDWSQKVTTDSNGEFLLMRVPVGEYAVSVSSTGFAPTAQSVVVESGTSPVLHYQLAVASKNENVTVSGTSEVVPTDTATPITLVDRKDIEQTPGADLTNSLAMITDYVPGAYFTHDMLHIRGGHQTMWLLDGVPVINTAIAVNVGPQFDPNDIDYLEVESRQLRGGIWRPHVRRL